MESFIYWSPTREHEACLAVVDNTTVTTLWQTIFSPTKYVTVQLLTFNLLTRHSFIFLKNITK